MRKSEQQMCIWLNGENAKKANCWKDNCNLQSQSGCSDDRGCIRTKKSKSLPYLSGKGNNSKKSHKMLFTIYALIFPINAVLSVGDNTAECGCWQMSRWQIVILSPESWVRLGVAGGWWRGPAPALALATLLGHQPPPSPPEWAPVSLHSRNHGYWLGYWHIMENTKKNWKKFIVSAR